MSDKEPNFIITGLDNIPCVLKSEYDELVKNISQLEKEKAELLEALEKIAQIHGPCKDRKCNHRLSDWEIAKEALTKHAQKEEGK